MRRILEGSWKHWPEASEKRSRLEIKNCVREITQQDHVEKKKRVKDTGLVNTAFKGWADKEEL